MTPVERLTDRKHEAIVQAAIAEFRIQGFQLTSMDKIAARAGVSKRTVYNHFPSKENLFAEILDRLWTSSVTSASDDYQSGQPLREQLLKIVAVKMALLVQPSYLDLARVAIAETLHSPALTGDMVARFGEREEQLTVWLRAAQTEGRLKAIDVVFAGQQLHALVKAFAFWPQVTLGQAPLSPEDQARVVGSAVDMFLAQYAADTDRV